MQSKKSRLRLSQIFVKQNPHLDYRLLQKKRVAILGVGQLGSQVSLLLAKSGLGEIRMLDPDSVARRNTSLALYGEDDVGDRKVFALARRLTELAPWCRFNYRSLEAPTGFEQTQDFDDKMRRVQDFLRGSDVLVTCLDNVGSRVSGALAAKAAFLTARGGRENRA